MKMDQEKDRKTCATPLRATVNFLFEAGMLKKTPRSGYQFLGTGRESVADHSFRMAIVGYALARLAGNADPARVALLCLFHDVPEARVGDMNYVNKQYHAVAEDEAVAHAADGLPFGGEYAAFVAEFRDGETQEARLARDADQLDLMLELKEQQDLGNPYAKKWIEGALGRIKTPAGREMAREILATDHTEWWFDGHDHWWR